MHLKRLAASRYFRIPRKKYKWVIRPNPGPHPIDRCLPLLVIVRDVLKYADNAREAKYIIKSGKIKVDGRIRKDPKFPVGLMDVIAIDDIEEYYRILIKRGGAFMFKQINEKEASFKLCRIVNKTAVKNGKIQLNLHDGKNCLVDQESQVNYKTCDTVILSLPNYSIRDLLKFEKGATSLITDGRKAGYVGHIEEFKESRKSRVTLRCNSTKVETIKDYVFVIGKEKPTISL